MRAQWMTLTVLVDGAPSTPTNFNFAEGAAQLILAEEAGEGKTLIHDGETIWEVAEDYQTVYDALFPPPPVVDEPVVFGGVTDVPDSNPS